MCMVARTWKQPRCPLLGEWTEKLWYIHTVEHYSATEGNTSESAGLRRMSLEPVIQSGASQKEKNKYHVLTHICGI